MIRDPASRCERRTSISLARGLHLHATPGPGEGIHTLSSLLGSNQVKVMQCYSFCNVAHKATIKREPEPCIPIELHQSLLGRP